MSFLSSSSQTFSDTDFLIPVGIRYGYDTNSKFSMFLYFFLLICVIIGIIFVVRKVYMVLKKTNNKLRRKKQITPGPVPDPPLEPQTEDQEIKDIINGVQSKADDIKNKINDAINGVLEDEKVENFRLLK